MEKADGGEIGLDGGSGLLLFLEIGHIGINVFGGDVGQALQAVPLGQKAAEPLHGLIVALFGPKAALPVVAMELVQLCEKILIMF